MFGALPSRQLCFHHSDADSNFAGSHLRSRKSLWAELDKYVRLCMNCHNELHAGLIDIPRGVGADG
jgi:hypothetical protein